MVNINLEMEEKDKIEAEKLFAHYGLTLEEAFNQFIKYVLKTKNLDFIKSSEIEYVDSATFEELSKKTLKKYDKAFKELSKK